MLKFITCKELLQIDKCYKRKGDKGQQLAVCKRKYRLPIKCKQLKFKQINGKCKTKCNLQFYLYKFTKICVIKYVTVLETVWEDEYLNIVLMKL